MPRLVLVVDGEASNCRHGGCNRLSFFVRNSLTRPDLDVRTATDVEAAAAFPQPVLVVARASGDTDLSRLAEAREGIWSAIPLLGVLCGPAAPEHPLLERLDDFLLCPVQPLDLALRVRRLLQRFEPVRRSAPAPAERSRAGLEALVGESGAIVRVLERIPRLAGADAPVLISGETGTGKELVARAIHYRSERQAKPFVPLNCGAMPENLVENELFGHVKGAFTDASSSEAGLLAEAEGGTLFLDEVDSLGPAAQVKLLRLLQNWEYRPLGSSKVRKADVRILAATNSDLSRLVAAHRFREDLYYRLNVLGLHLPPLRERTGDIPLLANRFLDRFARRYTTVARRFAPAALRRLGEHDWPGNVRELESVIQRAVLLADHPDLRAEDLEISGSSRGAEARPAEGLREIRANAVQSAERACLVTALAAFHGNVSQAARSVGKERRTFQRMMRKYAIERESFLP
jgi:DNA-binding NtrC family response regulator